MIRPGPNRFPRGYHLAMAATLTSPTGDHRVRLIAIAISLVASRGLLAAKFYAYRLTGSTAIRSDALESIVDVAAAVFAIGALILAGGPADQNHPDGPGTMQS